MRVLMTTDTVGGVWTFTCELARGLLRRGCPIALVALGGLPNGEQRAWLEQTQSRWGSRITHTEADIPLEWMQDNENAYFGAEPVLLRSARDFCPDLLLSSQFCFGALPIDVPRIIVAHSDVLSWADACRDAKLERSAWLDHYMRLVKDGLNSADAVVSPTQWMMDALSIHFSLPVNRRVIPIGRTIPDKATGSHRKLQAVTAGRVWDEAKHIGLLCEIASPMPLLVAGSQDGHSCRAPDARGSVQYLGPMPEHELLTLFRESAIYICTSRYEPFGLAPLEAAFCGCAVLANDIASLREVWRDGALYFQEASSLEGILDRLQRHPELLAKAQRESYARALSFSTDAMVNGYLSLFDQISAHKEASLAA